MKKTILVICTVVAGSLGTYAQVQSVGIGTSTPQSILDIVSTGHGLLVPRMTASQIEAIVAPDESELVYSLTDDGAVVDSEGFWFYYLGGWQHLAGASITAQNIYNTDGTLTANRTVDQNGNFLNFGPGLLYLDPGSSNVGIHTTSPTRTLDVDGDLTTQSLAGGGNVIADAQGVLMQDAFFDYGDVKPSFLSADHDGWYLLDGRSIASLPATAQANATLLGIGGTLPDAAGRYSMGSTATTGDLSGSDTVTLVRANLAAMNVVYTAASAGAHTHNFAFSNTRITTPTVTGGNNIHVHWLGGTYAAGAGYGNPTTSLSHNHSYSIDSGGSDLPVSVAPRAINFNYFVYLGQ